jgi:tryptophan-rich sensory protein
MLFFCTSFDHDSFVEKMLLRVWAILFSLAGIKVPIVFSRGGHLSVHCFLSLFLHNALWHAFFFSCPLGMFFIAHTLLAHEYF